MKRIGTVRTAVAARPNGRQQVESLYLADALKIRFKKAKMKLLLTHTLALIVFLLLIFFGLG